MGVCLPVLQILTRFQTKKCNSTPVRVHIRKETWPRPLGRNHVIPQYQGLATSRPLVERSEPFLADESLHSIGRKHKNYSNPFRIRLFLFLSYLFGIETIKMFILSRIFFENPTRFQTKMGKVYTRFQTKTTQNPTRWGGTYPYGVYKGVPPTPPPPSPEAGFRSQAFFPRFSRCRWGGVALTVDGYF